MSLLAIPGTDGVWDNLFVHDLLAYLRQNGAMKTPQDIANWIGTAAVNNAADPDFASPFEVAMAALR
jgi:hypothetical protein